MAKLLVSQYQVAVSAVQSYDQKRDYIKAARLNGTQHDHDFIRAVNKLRADGVRLGGYVLD